LRSHTSAPEARFCINAAEPRSKIFAAIKIGRSERSGTKRDVAVVRDPGDWERIVVVVGTKFRDPSLNSVFWENIAPMLKQSGYQLSGQVRTIFEVADAHGVPPNGN